MQNPIHTHQTRQGYGEAVVLAHCRLCDDTIVSVQYSHLEAADYGRLHVQNTHTSVRWSASEGNRLTGRLPGSDYHAAVHRTSSFSSWFVFNLDDAMISGGTKDTEIDAIHAAEAEMRLFNDPR